MRVLVIGAGGREHALAWKLRASPRLSALFIAPGNPGTAQLGTNVAIDPADPAAIVAFCTKSRIDLVVIGPEGPLVAGLVDDLAKAGIRAFGPSQAAARLEGSKAFTKAICEAAGIPTAAYARFTSKADARAHLRSVGAPIVVKHDGLMAGKGVFVASRIEEAQAALDTLYRGEPEACVVIETLLEGWEVSYFALIDGETIRPLGAAQDHKRAHDGDLGPNTGGMGAYSPVPGFDASLEAEVLDRIIRPAARAMCARGTPYRGVLFAGLMITKSGPMLIEFNCRFGDPECQVLMVRLETDLLDLLDAAVSGGLAGVSVSMGAESAVGVVVAARGYPGEPATGGALRGLEAAEAETGAMIFQAGTALLDGGLIARGGRVLTICARGQTLETARAIAYSAANRIDFSDGFFRRDIAAAAGAHR